MIAGMHCIVTGRVQGVWFRASTRERALALGLGGWVRNRDDGAVEVQAFGEAEQLRLLLAWLHEGPPAARVDAVRHRDCAAEACSGFEVID